MNLDAGSLKDRFSKLLEKLGLEEVQVLLKMMEPIEIQPYQVLSHCGEYSDSFLMVWEGKLSLSLSFKGKEIVLGDIGSGQFSGVAAVIDPGPALLTVTAVESGTVLRLTHAKLALLRATYPSIGSKLLRAFSLNLANWLRNYEEYMTKRVQPDNIVDFFRIGRLEPQI